MGLTKDLGHRVELVSMDPHFHNITVALYQQQTTEGPEFLVHSYSVKEGTARRIAFIGQAMAVLGGMELAGGQAGQIRFPCGSAHPLACRRVFLEACKLDPAQPVDVRPLWILDKKSNRTITVTSQGQGVYHLTADGEETERANRIAAVANGLLKLGQMETQPSVNDRVAFACGQPHDALVGLLLIRALNVRAVLREQEMAASRGILSAPSAQK
jgi:hypothetical protein